MAYLQAYAELVKELGGLPSDASSAGAVQAVKVVKAGKLFASAKGTGKSVRDVSPGMTLHPTGERQGTMWEVDDPMGNRGWISSTLPELSN